MVEEFQIHILSAERDFYQGPCLSLVLPTLDGDLGIMAHHTPLVSAVIPGKLSCILSDNSRLTAVVSHGLIRVENNDVLVLVDSAERPEEIDAARARRAAEQAREELLHHQSGSRYEPFEICCKTIINNHFPICCAYRSSISFIL